MTSFGGLTFLPLTFDKDGQLNDPPQKQAVANVIAGGVTDLFVVSHGWQNDAGTAISLYDRLFGNVAKILASRGMGNRKVAVAGVFWPSKPRYKDYGSLNRPVGGGGGAASATGLSASTAEIINRLNDFKTMFADDSDAAVKFAQIDEAAAFAGQLDNPAVADKFVAKLRGLVSNVPSHPDEDRTDKLVGTALAGSALLKELEGPVGGGRRPVPGVGGATSMGTARPSSPTASDGSAAGLFNGVKAGAMRFVDMLSYYEMKERSAKVGTGLNAVLAELRATNPKLRIHLVGHSFGGRLVTSAVSGPTAFAPASLTLLQAAFSHNAFSANYAGTNRAGFFRKVVANKLINGPIVITHTRNDSAVGKAYALASKLGRQEAAGVGDSKDRYGGLGSNGAIDTTEAKLLSMTDATKAYAFGAGVGVIFNLKADAYIKDREGQEAHGDVYNLEVANVVASAAGF